MEASGLDKDLEKMFALNSERMEKMAVSGAVIDMSDPIRDLSLALHPPCLKLMISDVRQEIKGVRSYRLISSRRETGLPYFRAGQYLSLKAQINNKVVSRPYTISSAPYLSENFYELTIAYKEGGFVSEYIWDSWQPGFEIIATGPHGNCYYDPLRDQPDLIALAGGSGIAPIRSLINEMIKTGKPRRMICLYGSRDEKNIIFQAELAELARQHPEQFTLIHVLSEPTASWQGYRGFITAEVLQKAIDDPLNYSYFICGPPEMSTFCLNSLAKLGIPRRSIRSEPTATADIPLTDNDQPQDNRNIFYAIQYTRREKTGMIKALAAETILTALERAGLNPDAQCRSGECGFCRALLLSGSVLIRKDGDGRRAADLEYGYIHTCSTYPLSDLQLIIT